MKTLLNLELLTSNIEAIQGVRQLSRVLGTNMAFFSNFPQAESSELSVFIPFEPIPFHKKGDKVKVDGQEGEVTYQQWDVRVVETEDATYVQVWGIFGWSTVYSYENETGENVMSSGLWGIKDLLDFPGSLKEFGSALFRDQFLDDIMSQVMEDIIGANQFYRDMLPLGQEGIKVVVTEKIKGKAGKVLKEVPINPFEKEVFGVFMNKKLKLDDLKKELTKLMGARIK